MIENAPILAPKKANKLGKHKTFFTWVYMNFKRGKRFRFAPSFNEYFWPKYEFKKDLPPDNTYGVVVDVIIDEEVVVEPVPVTPSVGVSVLVALLALFSFPEVVVTPSGSRPGPTVLPVPVWLPDWALLFEFPLLCDPADEGILVVTKKTNWYYLHFSNNIRQFWEWAQHKTFAQP